MWSCQDLAKLSRRWLFGPCPRSFNMIAGRLLLLLLLLLSLLLSRPDKVLPQVTIWPMPKVMAQACYLHNLCVLLEITRSSKVQSLCHPRHKRSYLWRLSATYHLQDDNVQTEEPPKKIPSSFPLFFFDTLIFGICPRFIFACFWNFCSPLKFDVCLGF